MKKLFVYKCMGCIAHKRVYRRGIVGIGIVISILILISCPTESSGGGGGGGNPDPIPTLSVVETPKRAATDIRDSYGIFTLSTDVGTISNYHLAVKEDELAVPTAIEMSSEALKRNISTTEIHVLIAQRLNAPMVTFAKRYFGNTTYQTIGTNMRAQFYTVRKSAFIYDTNAEDMGSEKWVNDSVLKPSTLYALYGMKDGEETSVSKLLTFTTDAITVLGSTGVADTKIQCLDTTLENGFIDISINPNEVYIFPVQNDIGAGGTGNIGSGTFHARYMLATTNTTVNGADVMAINNDMLVLTQTGGVPTTGTNGFMPFDSMFFMFRNLPTPTSNAHRRSRGFVLFDTSLYAEIVFRGGYIFDTVAAAVQEDYSTLVTQ